MSRRPNLIRRVARAYIQYMDSAAEKLVRIVTRAPIATDTAADTASSTASATAVYPPAVKPTPPACFSTTATANSHSTLRNLRHYLSYTRQPEQRTIFALQPTDSVDAFRVLDDRSFGGTTEARVRMVERVREDGERVSVLRYEGEQHSHWRHIHPHILAIAHCLGCASLCARVQVNCNRCHPSKVEALDG